MRRYWTLPEIARFRALYPFTPMDELMRQFGRTRAAIKNMAFELRLQKADHAGRFEPGNKPWNAGRHYNAGGRSTLTRFQRGVRGPRQRPVGSERVTRDGIEVKVAEPNQWMPKARYLWECEHGPIPAGMVVRDGRVITRAENARLNARNRRPRSKPVPLWLAPIVRQA